MAFRRPVIDHSERKWSAAGRLQQRCDQIACGGAEARWLSVVP
jgi:hypothetical protein